jgi:hypothetical protein
MRNREIRLVEYLVAVEDQIEIERTGRARMGALAAELAFDVEQPFEERARVQRGFAGGDRVQEPRLFADPDRLRVVEG